MDSTTVNKFRDGLKSFVEQVVSQHAPLRVTRRNGADFVVMSAEDWERDQETLPPFTLALDGHQACEQVRLTERAETDTGQSQDQGERKKGNFVSLGIHHCSEPSASACSPPADSSA